MTTDIIDDGTVILAEQAIALSEGQSALAIQQAASIIQDQQGEVADIAAATAWQEDRITALETSLLTMSQQVAELLARMVTPVEAEIIAETVVEETMALENLEPSSEALSVEGTEPTMIVSSETSTETQPSALADGSENGGEVVAVVVAKPRKERRFL